MVVHTRRILTNFRPALQRLRIIPKYTLPTRNRLIPFIITPFIQPRILAPVTKPVFNIRFRVHLPHITLHSLLLELKLKPPNPSPTTPDVHSNILIPISSLPLTLTTSDTGFLPKAPTAPPTPPITARPGDLWTAKLTKFSRTNNFVLFILDIARSTP